MQSNTSFTDSLLSVVRVWKWKTVDMLHHRDDIHMSPRGSSALISAINSALPVVKERGSEISRRPTGMWRHWYRGTHIRPTGLRRHGCVVIGGEPSPLNITESRPIGCWYRGLLTTPHLSVCVVNDTVRDIGAYATLQVRFKCSFSTKCVKSIYSFSFKIVLCIQAYFIWFYTFQTVRNITLVSWLTYLTKKTKEKTVFGTPLRDCVNNIKRFALKAVNTQNVNA